MATAPKPTLTHRDLCLIAGRWLRGHGCTVVILEPYSVRSPELPDAIGWRRGCESILVECKTSRADYLADARKVARQAGGYLGRQRYYLAPWGVIQPADLPEGWGLLAVRGSRVTIIVKAPTIDLTNDHCEVLLLVEQLERVQDGRPLHLMPAPGQTMVPEPPTEG